MQKLFLSGLDCHEAHCRLLGIGEHFSLSKHITLLNR